MKRNIAVFFAFAMIVTSRADTSQGIYSGLILDPEDKSVISSTTFMDSDALENVVEICARVLFSDAEKELVRGKLIFNIVLGSSVDSNKNIRFILKPKKREICKPVNPFNEYFFWTIKTRPKFRKSVEFAYRAEVEFRKKPRDNTVSFKEVNPPPGATINPYQSFRGVAYVHEGNEGVVRILGNDGSVNFGSRFPPQRVVGPADVQFDVSPVHAGALPCGPFTLEIHLGEEEGGFFVKGDSKKYQVKCD